MYTHEKTACEKVFSEAVCSIFRREEGDQDRESCLAL
jgi:hypothetical protein